MFSAPCGSGGGGVDRGGWVVVGGAPPTHTHTHACMHAHAHVVNMIISCKWLSPLGEFLGIPYDVIRECVCMHVHICGGHPLTTPHIYPPLYTPRRGTPGISQNSIALELIEIFQFHLKIWNLWRLPHPWVGVWFGGWEGGLMGGVRSNH